MRIALDADSVVISLAEWFRRYNRDYNDNVTLDIITEWNTAKFVKPECGEKIYGYLKDPDLYDHCEPEPGAIEGVKRLRELGHELTFVTSGLHPGKFEWFKRHGLIDGEVHYEKDYMTYSDKVKLIPLFDLLIDDRAETVRDWKAAGGRAILFDQPWNRWLEHKPRAHGWQEVLDIAAVLPDQFPPARHITERRCPEQTAAFREILDQMYAIHLDKNADYSPANILGPGEIGLATRVWDKVTRLMNLMGFRIDARFIEFVQCQKPKNEPIDDNLMDLAVYAIIWQIYRKGAWGK